MPTRINGDDVRVPGYVYLENPAIGLERVLVTGPDKEIITSIVSLANLEALGTMTWENVPSTLVLRDENGSFAAEEITAVDFFGSFSGPHAALTDYITCAGSIFAADALHAGNGASDVLGGTTYGSGFLRCYGDAQAPVDILTYLGDTPGGGSELRIVVTNWYFTKEPIATGAGELEGDSDGKITWVPKPVKGSFALGNAVVDGTVTGLALPFTPSYVFCKVRMPSGGTVITASDQDASLTADGFIFNIDPATDSADYFLDYIIYP